MTLPLLRVDHSDAKERAYYHRKAVIVQAPNQATVDKKCVEFRGHGTAVGAHSQLYPRTPNLYRWPRVRLFVFSVDQELSNGNRECPAEL
ncbi:MAG: hypothetical protein A4E19_13005 [Nitrospira sp. SG-bin1]|nr:MAG: hypothetical protein A4E19_13005 [Nitrospira sp. SG-bin1]